MSSEENDPLVLKFPAPLSIEQKLQNTLAAIGIPPSQVHVKRVGPDPQDLTQIELSLSPEAAEKVQKFFSIKLHTESGYTNVNGVGMRLEVPDETLSSPKGWGKTEQRRRSKKDSDKSELPDH